MMKAVIFDWFGVLVQNDIANQELLDIVSEVRSRGMKVFVLSNSDKSLAARQIEKFPFLLNSFDGYYYSGKTGYTKPDLRAFDVVLKENNLKPEECIYFDDSSLNVSAAALLGIESYLFDGAGQVREKIS